jgi:diaminohydroxyphosphoribosylaminopyrimidine deaminase/5-amino-6-(5-phosphoribosylamino)uracil reductase
MDAIVVGRGTVLADDPLLTARPPGPRTPARAVVSASGELPSECRLLSTAAEAPVIVYTLPTGPAKLSKWLAGGAEVVSVADVPAVLEDMGRRSFTNILVEGGAKLLGSFLDARAVDEFHVFIAPKVIGGDGPLIRGMGIEHMADALALDEFTCVPSGEEVYLHGFAPGALDG